MTEICGICGGPRTTDVYGCLERPGALTMVEAYDQLVLADLEVLNTAPPAVCPDCAAAASEPHHAECSWARCGNCHCARDECGCDDAWLAAAARVPWRDRLRWPRRWPRLRLVIIRDDPIPEIIRGNDERTTP